MTKDRWLDLISTVKDSFPIVREGQEPVSDDRPGTKDFIEFEGPLGLTRLEFLTLPIVTGKRGIGGHKVGAGSSVQYEYSQEESSTKFLAYRQVDGQWQPIDASSFAPPDA